MEIEAIAELAGRAFAGAEETIADVGRLAQKLLAVDFTILSEITGDGRYVFRSLETAVELPIAAGDAIPYALSLCSRVHARESPAVVPDVRAAPAMWANWQQLKPGLGVDWDILGFMTVDVPLPGGDRFGTLCVHHRSPRGFSADEQAVLAILARLAGDEVARSRAAGQLDAALAELAAAERRRAELVDELAHELRAPLQVIDGYAEAMLDGVIERDDEHVVLVRRESARSIRLLDDLRLLTQLEAGETREQGERVAVDRLLAETQQRLAPLAEAAGARIGVEAEALAVEAVPARLEQALANLVRNAIRAVADGGGSEIVLSGSAAQNDVVIAVSDDGRGLAADEAERIFERFYRGAGGREAGPGSGLGLTIARRIAKDAGGSLTAEPRTPRGTSFVLRLPRAP
jgi:signal transduction histidine kinase